LRTAFKAFQVSKSREQSILQGVFCILWVAHDAESGMKKSSLMEVEESVKRLSIAVPACLNQTLFTDLHPGRKLSFHCFAHSLDTDRHITLLVCFAAPYRL